jgi:hypothetical protein
LTIGLPTAILFLVPRVNNAPSVGRSLTAALNVRIGRPNLVLANEGTKLESAPRGPSTGRAVKISVVQIAASAVRNSRIALGLAAARNAQPSPPALAKTIAVSAQTNFRIVPPKIVVPKIDDPMLAGPVSLINAAMQARGAREASPIKRAAEKG